VRIPPDLYEAAAARLVSAEAGDARLAGRRFVAAAPAHGIDLGLMWGTIDPKAPLVRRVRQVCLAVMGSGRTAILFLSGPEPGRRDAATRSAEQADRVGAIREACGWLATERAGQAKIIQSLPDPGETWAITALKQAGFHQVGDLAYLRRPLSRRRGAGPPEPVWPEGVVVRRVRGVSRGEPDRALLADALERSYEQTLDCPGLCGLRQTEDVIDSHIATGEFDPSRWWLVMQGDEAHGCALFSACPEQSTVELVYLGLSPQWRGRGLAAMLLSYGLSHLGGAGQLSVTCAVDRQNSPAIALYRRAGFSEFSGRVALVRGV
jgi:ribosomal protein S18 acetylase RimI-like enzyme